MIDLIEGILLSEPKKNICIREPITKKQYGVYRSYFWYSPRQDCIVDANETTHVEVLMGNPDFFQIPLDVIEANSSIDLSENIIRVATENGWVRCNFTDGSRNRELSLQSVNKQDLWMTARKWVDWFNPTDLYIDNNVSDNDASWYANLQGEQIDYYLKTGRISRRLVGESKDKQTSIKDTKS